ncbi:MAG TPA: phage portal protein [Acidimicrobiales bacterium]
MGLGKLLTRSSPNFGSVVPNAGPTPASPQPWYPPSNILPPTTEANALSVPAFWAGYRYVCGAVGELPVAAYRGTELIDPQPGILAQPDPNQTAMAFWAAMTASLTLYGNAICIITGYDRLGYPTSLKPVHPLMVAVRFIGNPMNPDIGAFYCAGQLYDPDQIWHCKSHLARPGWPLGRGIIDSMSDAVTMNQALQNYAANYFVNGGMPYGILKIHRPEITQAQADQAKADWILKYSGAPTPAVLNELTDFTPLAYKPVDSQMIESRQFGLIEMALMWGLPPSKLGANIGGSTYKNAEMEEVQARNDAVAPWTRLLEQSIGFDWLPRGQHAEWDLTASLRTDTLTQYQAYQAALGGPGPQSQWILVDEIRAQQNMDPMAVVEAQITAQVVAAGVDVAEELPPVPTNTPPAVGGPDTATPYPQGDTLPAPPANAGPPQ